MAKKPHPFDVAVGDCIRRARVARKLSQTDLGKVAGITFQQVQKYERGTNRVSPSKMYMMAPALGVTPSALLRRAETIMEEGE
jgi:transcriptional regulator with XRE-family HTH domain